MTLENGKITLNALAGRVSLRRAARLAIQSRSTLIQSGSILLLSRLTTVVYRESYCQNALAQRVYGTGLYRTLADLR